MVPDETQSVPVLMEKGSLVEAAGGRRTVLEVDDVLKVGRLSQDRPLSLSGERRIECTELSGADSSTERDSASEKS